MLVDRLSLNVGANTVIYVEMHSGDTPEAELKYGDTKFDADDGKLLVWYGTDNSEMSGWVKSPWGSANYTAALLKIAADSKNNPDDIVWRVMNNDIDFDESTYDTSVPAVVEPNKLAIENKGE